ncbi:shufflon system plasmid conjugative transfer pilus tip adhesin PilV [Burkholderia ambifaria]|uniref:shufflon system plasmid conjugative transfer pilus tip adhesin PilV n=1 Tax=Burkholderia ambifaria TaxID=152480 RepID=UPI00158F2059|nr:shufflon system plasmid conjugative transfer pilus tip adhesin PilV [Burkholderia ambifaria]
MSSFFGVLYAMLVTVTAMSGLYAWSKIGFANVQAAVIASQGVVIGQAMNKYLNDTSTALAQIATPSTPATVTVDQLAQAGYLPKSVSMRNAYGQDWQMQVLQPVPGQLQALLFTTGGRQMPTSVLVPSAAQTSAQGILGGFVPYANQFGDASLQPTVAVGANGTFRQALGSYANPGSGHLAAMLGIANAQADNGFLYRVDMKPARPDLNAMQTDLSMTDTQGNAHNINGADVVNANAFRLANGAGMNGDQGGSLELGDMSGTYPGQVPYVDFHYGGKGAQDFNVRVMNDGDNHLMVSGANGQGSLGVQGTLQAGNIAVASTSCSPNGKIAANSDGSGQILSCQFGTWLPIGGRWLRYGYYTVYDAWWVPAPTCPNGGSMQIQVTPQNFAVNNTSVVNSGPATWTGNGWQVHLTDGSGNGIPGAQGIAATYCSY